MNRLLRAISRLLVVVAGVVVAVFFLLRIVPGDPARMILGERATPEAVEQLRDQLGLNESLSQQFAAFVARLFTHGDTGISLVTGESSRGLILERAPISLGLVGVSLLFALSIAIPLALLAARRHNRLPDHIIRVLTNIGVGMPIVWSGVLLIALFAVQLGWLPAGGIGKGPGEPFRSLVLPGIAVAIGLAPVLIRSLRAQLIEVQTAEWVTTLRAAGVAEWRITWRHVLRGAALPTLTLLGVSTAYLVGGTFVVERVFALNGMGTLLFDSISTRDFPVVQGITLLSALAVVLITAVADLLGATLDPRIRRSQPRAVS